MICSKSFKGFGCGQCFCCRINKRRENVTRLLAESLFHDDSTFITLTLDDNTKETGYGVKYGDFTQLNKSYIQAWLNRFRMRVSPTRIRYFLVGEYGKQTLRPHYHAILFGWPPCLYGGSNQMVFRQFDRPCPCPSCVPVHSTWAIGKVTLDRVEPESLQYVAGYVVDKIDEVEGFESWRINSDGLGAQLVQHIVDNPDVDVWTRMSTVKMFGKELPLGRYLKEKIKNVQMSRLQEDEEKKVEAQLAAEAFFQRLAERSATYKTFLEEVEREKINLRRSRWEYDIKQQKIFNKLAHKQVRKGRI